MCLDMHTLSFIECALKPNIPLMSRNHAAYCAATLHEAVAIIPILQVKWSEHRPPVLPKACMHILNIHAHIYV